MFTIHFKNGNMLPIIVHDELTLIVMLETGSVSYVISNNGVRRNEESLREYYELN